MLPGRTDEVAWIDRLVDGARGGVSAALIVCGDPGIGKTALLDEIVATAAGFTVLRARPLQTESELPFGMVHVRAARCSLRTPGACSIP